MLLYNCKSGNAVVCDIWGGDMKDDWNGFIPNGDGIKGDGGSAGISDWPDDILPITDPTDI